MMIQHNLLAMNASNVMGINTKNRQKSMERLSSGYHINRAADDAAGLAISEKMRAQIRGLTRAAQNAQDGISLCQTADGALSEVTNMLHRMTELSVQASNTAVNNLEDRQSIQKEINELLNEIDRVSDTTEFNKKLIFSKKAEGAKATGQADSGEMVSIYGLEYDRAKESLLNGSFRQVAEPITLSNGQVLSKKDSNALIKSLSNAVIGHDIAICFYKNICSEAKCEDWNYTNYGMFVDRIESRIPQIIENTKESYEYSDSDQFKSDLEDGLDDLSRKNYSGAEYFLRKAGNNSDSNYSGRMALSAFDSAWLIHSFHSGQSITNPSNIYTRSVEASLGLLNSLGINSSDTDMFIKKTLDSTNRRPIDVYNAEVGGGVRNIEGTIVKDSEAPIVFAYMSLFDDLKKSLPVNKESGEGKVNEEDDRGWWLQVGANAGQGINLRFGYMDTQVIGVSGINVTTLSGAQDGITRSQDAMNYVTKMRSKIGAYQNRIEYAVKIDNNTAENLQAAESRIRDEDMAEGVSLFSKNSILEQAAQSMLAQANQTNQGIVSLLQ